MHSEGRAVHWWLLGWLAVWVGSCNFAFAQPQATNEIRIVEIQGAVEVSPAGATTWVLTQTNQILYPADRLRTATNSRVALRWSDQSVVTFGASTELEILAPHSSDAQSGLRLTRGIMSFFHRDKPGRIRVLTRGAIAGVEGTEFVLEVAAADTTERATLSVIDGKVRLANEQGELLLASGEQGVAETGRPPVRTAGFIANNLLQWSFYDPAVIDLTELPLTADEQGTLADSLSAYRAGDLLAALAKYPAARAGVSDAEHVYHAALLLSVGEVVETEAELATLSATETSTPAQKLANALRQVIAAVNRRPESVIVNPQLASELLASSYYEQSRAKVETSLTTALELAKRAVAQSPDFAFGWERVAELEFAFGNTGNALDALNRSLNLAPRNAQALALRGFLLAAKNKTHEAIASFDQAIAIDAALGNAWLGRGLCRIRRGDGPGGREDLLVAAALEPQRSVLRSYLGKADANIGDRAAATKELRLAKQLDPNDPTAWLYSALLNQQDSQINRAISDLEKSQELNDNRRVYRSQLLLDQDRAVRSANLAAIYQDAGMNEVALREASRAVNDDYANYSAHLFLANSYETLRDPNLINLRYETAAQSEYLLANLLAPANAGVLSSAVSQQEYSRLFERDHMGVASITEYLSRGAWMQSGVQYGVFGNFSYDVGAFYRWDPGQRPNNDLDERQLSLTLRYEFTPQDTAYVRVEHFQSSGGDLAQRYNPNTASLGFRFEEKQEPNLVFGYHHEWQPGVHTLFLFSRLDDTAAFTNSAQPTLLYVALDPSAPIDLEEGRPFLAQEAAMHQHFENKLEIYSGELQQIWQQPRHDTIIGGRIQYGDFRTMNLQIDPLPPFNAFFPTPPDPAALQDFSSTFKRFSVYGYHQWQVLDPLKLVGGVVYDWITFPENFRTAPISDGEQTEDQVSPKAGLIWTPLPDTTVRFAYTRSLSGASLDQSYQLEPSQVAGFVQSFRSIIPEAIVGGNAGAKFESFAISLEQKFASRTYLGVSGEILNSDVRRVLGAFDGTPNDTSFFALPSGLRQNLDYEEQSLQFTVNQLVGQCWSVGAQYRLSRAILKEDLLNVAEIPGLLDPTQRLESILHHVGVFAIFNHHSGFFAGFDAQWYAQSNIGYTPDQPGDDFWQFNIFAGYRFWQRRAEAKIGLLNLTDQDYRLSPLNIYNELPRSRTLAVQFQLNF